MTLGEIRADLHIHTCLSPCADDTMTPAAIVRQAKRRGLDLIGICDHNSAENVQVAREAGRRQGVAVLGGIEVTTREEIHVMGFFEEDAEVLSMQQAVYAHLGGENDPDTFGFQVVMDEDDRPVRLNDRLLIGAVDLSLERVVDAIHELGGLAIASHVNRDVFSITSQLGFIPPSLPLDGVEVAHVSAEEDWKCGNMELPILTFSDAHFLHDIGRACTVLHGGAPSFGELAMALRGAEGRCVKA